MKTALPWRVAALLIAPLCVMDAQAQTQAALSLSNCQREARARAPEAHAVQARLRAASALARDAQRVLRSDPALNLHYQADLEREGNSVWGAGLSWTLDVAGSWGPRAAAAAAEREQSRHEADEALLALDEAVAIAVADLALAQRQRERASKVAALQDIIAGAARRQLELGQGNQLEDDGAQLDLAAARAELARSQSGLELASTKLARLLGREDSGQLRVDDEDPSEPAEQPMQRSRPTQIDEAPLVRAASAASQAAREQLSLEERLIWPAPNLGVELNREQRLVPHSAFSGAPTDLSARWNEWQFGVTLALPLPLIDRNQERRAQASARAQTAAAQLQLARADAVAERLASSAELRSAVSAYRVLQASKPVLERSYGLLEQAARAGALDAVARAQAMQRLSEASQRLDNAVHDVRLAHAHFARHNP